MFFVAVLPQFVVPERGDVTLQLLGLGLVFILLAVVNDLVYGIAAGSVRDRLIGSSRRGRAVRDANGLLMICLGLRLATTGHTD